MRMTAPAIGGAAVVLALALVAYLGPDAEPPHVADRETPAEAEPAVDAPAARSDVVPSPRAPSEAPVAVSAGLPPSTVERAPLPGETPTTPMTQLMSDSQTNVIVGRTAEGVSIPPGLTQGEIEFAAEPVDAAWALGAEADLLAKFAQMPGLKLIDIQVECRSTMCRLQLTQPREASSALRGTKPFNLLSDSKDLDARWMMATIDGTGAVRSVAYLWREGFGRSECYKDGRPTTCSAETDESGD